MKLTGKAKEDFFIYNNITELNLLLGYSEREINALIIEWLDSVGIYIEIIRNEGYFEWYVNDTDGDYGFIDRYKATEKAIIKANEIYNNVK